MKRSLAITILLFASSQAIATVTEWGGAPAGDFTIDLNDNVTILGAGTFKFQSVTAGNLGSIRSISVANGVTGTVIVHVARNPADSAGMNGATNVGEINLTNDQGASLIGNLAELRITGDLGSLAPTVIRNLTGAISANDFLDTVTIENNLTVSGSISAGRRVPCPQLWAGMPFGRWPSSTLSYMKARRPTSGTQPEPPRLAKVRRPGLRMFRGREEWLWRAELWRFVCSDEYCLVRYWYVRSEARPVRRRSGSRTKGMTFRRRRGGSVGTRIRTGRRVVLWLMG